MDKQSGSLPVFIVDGVEDHAETAEGRLNLSGDSAISSASAVSLICDHPVDIVSLHIIVFNFYTVLGMDAYLGKTSSFPVDSV